VKIICLVSFSTFIEFCKKFSTHTHTLSLSFSSQKEFLARDFWMMKNKKKKISICIVITQRDFIIIFKKFQPTQSKLTYNAEKTL